MINSQIVKWTQTDIINQILVVMSELKENFSYLLLMNHQVIEKARQEYTKFGGNDNHHIIYESIEQLVELEKLSTYNIQSVGGPQQSLQNIDFEEKNELEKTIQTNIISLCNDLRSVPQLVSELKALKVETSTNVPRLLQVLTEMHEIFTKELKTNFSEQAEQEEFMKNLKSEITHEEGVHQLLEQELEKIRNSREAQRKHHEKKKQDLEYELEEGMSSHENQIQTLINEHTMRLEKLVKKETILIRSRQSNLDNLVTEDSICRARWAESEKDLRRKIRILENEKLELILENRIETEIIEKDYQDSKDFIKDSRNKIECLSFSIESLKASNFSEDSIKNYIIGVLRKLISKNDLSSDVFISKIVYIQNFWRTYREKFKLQKSVKIKKKKKPKKKGKRKVKSQNKRSIRPSKS